jgi:MerR family copper efflux transcriptional regulator
MDALKIGEVARSTGLPIDTIRYYERVGLLPEPARRPSGYRSYGTGAIRRLRFIHSAKALGFTLPEIKELLALDAGRNVPAVQAAARRKLADLDRRLAELTRIRLALASLVEHCPGTGAADSCPILAALNDEGGLDS